MSELRVVTVRQPWASLIALGHKRIEVRTRPTKFRGWVAIHAGAATVDPAWEGGGYAVARDGDGPFLYYGSLAFAARLPLGAIVAVARLIDCLPIHAFADCTLTMDDPHICDAPFPLSVIGGPFEENVSDQLDYAPAEMWTPGHHGWLLDDVRPLDQPIAHKGGLGLRRPTLDLAQRLAPYCGDVS